MAVVYITSQGAKLLKNGERLIVKKGEQIIRWFHTKDVTQLILLGNITLTAPVITFLLKNKIDTVFLSYYGKYKGRLVGQFGNNVKLRLKQYKYLSDEKNRKELSEKYVTAKIKNMLYLMQVRNYRLKSSKIASAFIKIKILLNDLDKANSIDSVRGFEGMASKHYFSVFNEFFPSGVFQFNGRTKRPPKDEINSLLSLGYTLLLNQISSNSYIVGLDPFFGALHTLEFKRQSLVLDLMEEYRPLIDDMVISLVNTAQISQKHFIYNDVLQPVDEDEILLPIMLSLDGMKKFVTAFNSLLNKKFYYYNEKHSLKNIFLLQIRKLANTFLKKDSYQGFDWKGGNI